MQKGGIQAIPVRCNGDAFPENFKPLNPYMKTVAAMLPIYSSIPIGWILRLERRGCWFESGLLY
jgi:hypothetical protein